MIILPEPGSEDSKLKRISDSPIVECHRKSFLLTLVESFFSINLEAFIGEVNEY